MNRRGLPLELVLVGDGEDEESSSWDTALRRLVELVSIGSGGNLLFGAENVSIPSLLFLSRLLRELVSIGWELNFFRELLDVVSTGSGAKRRRGAGKGVLPSCSSPTVASRWPDAWSSCVTLAFSTGFAFDLREDLLLSSTGWGRKCRGLPEVWVCIPEEGGPRELSLRTSGLERAESMCSSRRGVLEVRAEVSIGSGRNLLRGGDVAIV